MFLSHRPFIHLLSLSFVALICVTIVEGDALVECQDKTICKNRGTCLLTSQSVVGEICRQDETYFNKKCLRFGSDPLPWELASLSCSDYGGRLAMIESEIERQFLSQYLQKEMNKLEPPFREFGVWTSGHSVLNLTKVAYVWMPEHYVIEKTYWQPNQPNIYADYTNICIYVAERSKYLDWVTDKCYQEKYYVCSRNVAKRDQQDWTAQCLCSDGYSGQFCEIQPAAGELSSQKVACPNNPYEIACPSGQTIRVDFAVYGNLQPDESQPCEKPSLNGILVSTAKPEICVHPSSLQTVFSKCQGLTYCRIEVLSELFPNGPCLPSTTLSLHYRIRCSNEPQTSCRTGAIYYEGRCFAVEYKSNFTQRHTWEGAQHECNKKGGMLASTINEGIHNQLVAEMRKKSQSHSYYWIGDRTNHQGGLKFGGTQVFVPANSTIVGQNHCIYYNISSSYAIWNSGDCDELNNWICEFAPEQNSKVIETYTPDEPQRAIFMGTKPVNASNVVDNRLFCEAFEWKGLHFVRTPECSDAPPVRCPDPENTFGTVRLKCECGAKWESKPDTTNCAHKWVSELNEAIAKNQPAENISRDLSAHLKVTVNKGIYGGDITGSVNIGEQLIPLARRQFGKLYDRDERSRRATDFTQEFGEAGDQLLGQAAEQVWLELDKDLRIAKASSLMSSLEHSAILMAEFIYDQQRKINYQNWALEVQVKKRRTTTGETDGFLVMTSAPGDAIISVADDSSSRFHSTGTTRFAAKFASPPVEETVSFESFSLSPVLKMPSVDVLQQSTQDAVDGSMRTRIFSHQDGPQGFPGATRFAAVPPYLDRTPIKLGYYVFKSLGTLLHSNEKTIINSLVIGATVNDPSMSISLPASSPVNFTFYHIKKTGVRNPRCVFWEMSTSSWSESGCKLLRTSDDSTDCSCYHLTSFAILMDVLGTLEPSLSETSAAVLDTISIIGCALSITCLLFSFLIFTCFRSIWNVRNTIHRNLCLCLLSAELVFVIGVDRTEIPAVCSAIAVALHYLFLSAFCWMLLEGYQLYLMLIRVFEPDNVKILLYYLWAYGFPAVIVAVTAGVAWQNYGTPNYCWLNVDTPTIWAFVGPLTVVVLCNVVFLAVALKVVLSVKSRDRSRAQRVVGWLKGSATLLCLLGITWLFGYLMVISKAEPVFAYIFTILNCTQGIFIFVLHVVLNDKVRISVIRFLRTGLCCVSDPGAGYSSKSYISSRQRFLNMMKNSDSLGTDKHRSTDSTGLAAANNNLESSPPLIAKPPLGEYDANLPKKTTSYNEWRNRVNVGLTAAEKSIDNEDTVKLKHTKDSNDGPGNKRPNYVPQKNSETRRSAPVRRKKFPLGAAEEERGSQYGKEPIIIERF